MIPGSGEFPVALGHHGFISRQIKHVVGEGFPIQS